MPIHATWWVATPEQRASGDAADEAPLHKLAASLVGLLIVRVCKCLPPLPPPDEPTSLALNFCHQVRVLLPELYGAYGLPPDAVDSLVPLNVWTWRERALEALTLRAFTNLGPQVDHPSLPPTPSLAAPLPAHPSLA